MVKNTFANAARIIWLLVAYVCCLTAGAALNRLAVKTADNSITYFDLSATPRISFTPTEMVVTTGDGEILFALSNLKSYSFDEDRSGIVNISDDETSVNVRLIGRTLLSSAADVTVFSTTGHTMISSRQNPDTPVSLASLAPGVYVVKTGGSTFKISVK